MQPALVCTQYKMGSAASTAVTDDFGAFGDIHAVKSLCVQLEKDFDQTKFDAMKVSEDALQVYASNG